LNDTINNMDQWSSSTLVFNDGYTNSAGPWYNDINRFIGIRIKQNNDTLYGWIRVDVINSYTYETIRIHDFAYNTVPGQFVVAGESSPPIAENIVISDISNYGDGRDLKISFNKAIDESKVDEYRVIVVKDDSTDSFNSDSAALVAPDRYLVINPSGANVTDTLSDISKDSDGDFIQEEIAYRVFIYTIGDTILSVSNVLSHPSNSITLYTPAPPVSGVSAVASYSGGSEYRISVSFNKPIDESSIEKYRIFFVRYNYAGSFLLDSANTIADSGYYSVFPTGSNLQIQFSSDTIRDHKKNIIAHQTSYKVFVLSIAGGISANFNSLSAPSSSFILYSPAVSVTELIAEDVSNYGNSSDMRLTFRKTSVDSVLCTYKIFLVKLSDTTQISLQLADTLSSGCSFSFQTSDVFIDNILPENTKDKDGDFVTLNVPYRVYVQTVADSIHFDKSTISKGSNIISLMTPDYYKAGLDSGIGIFYTNIDPDVIINGIYNLDLNNDGTIDFKLSKHWYGSGHIEDAESYIVPYNNNKVAVISAGSLYPDTMMETSMINQDLFWNDTSCIIRIYYMNLMPPSNSYSYGIWGDEVDRYIGLYLNDGGFYGWIHLNTDRYSMTLLDYAWYDPSVSVQNIDFESKYSITPNPTSNILNIYSPDNSQIVSISIYDIFGKTHRDIKASSESIQIDISDLPQGIYFLKVKSSNEVRSYKILRE